MKKIIAFIAAFVTAVVMSTGAAAEAVSLSRLGSSADFFEESFLNSGVKAAELNKSRSVKNTLVIAEDEALVISDGCKLTLKNGCRVEGTLYIENGGYLAVSGGELEITGSVINDGTVSIGAKAALYVRSGGELFTSGAGVFKSKTEKIYLDENITAVCLGKNSVSGCYEQTKKALFPDVLSAAYVRLVPNGVNSAEVFSKEDALKYAAAQYFLEESVPSGGGIELLTILFDNGSALKIQFVRDKIVCIGNAEMRVLLKTVE